LKFDGSNFISLEWRTAFPAKDKATWIAQKLSALTECGSLLSCSQKSTIFVWKYSATANKYCQYYCMCGMRMRLQLQLNYWYWKVKAIVTLTTQVGKKNIQGQREYKPCRQLIIKQIFFYVGKLGLRVCRNSVAMVTRSFPNSPLLTRLLQQPEPLLNRLPEQPEPLLTPLV